MKPVKDLLPNDKTLLRRKQIFSSIESAIQQDPQAVADILQAISGAYKKGTITRFWDFVAALAGCDRGYGNDWFYTAIETLERSRK